MPARIASLLVLLVAVALGGLSAGCRASPEARLDRLRKERVRTDAEERDVLREIDRRQDLADERIDAYAAAVHAKYDAARKAYVGPSAETYRAAMSSPPAEDDPRFAERSARIESAKVAFVEADRKYAAILDPRERAYLDSLGKKRTAVHDKCNRKRVAVMTEYGARRERIDREIASIEGRRY